MWANKETWKVKLNVCYLQQINSEVKLYSHTHTQPEETSSNVHVNDDKNKVLRRFASASAKGKDLYTA